MSDETTLRCRMRCPRCGADAPFSIQLIENQVVWDEASGCECLAGCSFRGRVGYFLAVRRRRAAALEGLRSQTANLRMDGEEDAGGNEFDLAGDDAVDALHGLIRMAREIGPHGAEASAAADADPQRGIVSFADALCTVLELAKQNALDPNEPAVAVDDGLLDQAEEQQAAIDTVEDYADTMKEG